MGDVRNANPDQLDSLADLLHTSGDGGAYGTLTDLIARARDADASDSMASLRPLLTWLVDVAEEMRDRADLLRNGDPAPVGWQTVSLLTPTATPPDDTPDTQEEYFRDLCDDLGINLAEWDTSKGFAHNDEIIAACYEHYGDLFQRHPEVQWAGMARFAGDVVYSSLQDLHILRELSGDERVRVLTEALPGPLPPGMATLLAEATEEELEWYEDTFVEMQKEIFMDLGWQLHAYDQGGIAEMRRLAEAGELTPEQLEAWEDIASGDPERIAQGNEALVIREQRDILQNEYDEMLDRPLGDVMTYVFSVIAPSPVPDGRPFREVVDDVEIDLPEIEVGIDIPFGGPDISVGIDLPEIGVDTPLPTGNVANWDDRWQWIQEDMMPHYQDLLKNDPDRIYEEIERPVEERAQDYRLIPLPYDGN
jgi:hypothetical protein